MWLRGEHEKRGKFFEFYRMRAVKKTCKLAVKYGWSVRRITLSKASAYVKLTSYKGDKLTVRVSDHGSKRFKTNDVTSINLRVDRNTRAFDNVLNRLRASGIAEKQNKCLGWKWRLGYLCRRVIWSDLADLIAEARFCSAALRACFSKFNIFSPTKAFGEKYCCQTSVEKS